MRVDLAGYNLDTDHFDLVRRVIDAYSFRDRDSNSLDELLQELASAPLTPETLSAAYARISRSDKGIRELRRDSRASVNRARKSNERIVYQFGHASIAEHAVFNLDINGITRLAVERLEAHRLASYTEASQRYIPMSGDYLIPDEIRAVKLEEQLTELCDRLFAAYRRLTGLLEKHYLETTSNPQSERAREDARYVLPLSCRTQVGMTVNSRTAEAMIRKFNQSKLSEIRLLGRQIEEKLKQVAPSLIKYTEPDNVRMKLEKDFETAVASLSSDKHSNEDVAVKLISFPEQGERLALASMLFKVGGSSLQEAIETVDGMDAEQREQLLLKSHKYISSHDPVRREMELGYFTFAVTLSASAFAQFKRHRMATLIKQSYNPDLGTTIPGAIEDAGCINEFYEVISLSEDCFGKLREKLPDKEKPAADYALTNAHRCRVVFQANARELTHFSRLREDSHAQWDIRRIARSIINQAREACPGLMLFACGKDDFSNHYEQLYGS